MANALANGELGRIYGLQGNGPRQKGAGGPALSPKARRFVPVAATAAVAAQAEQDGTLSFFSEMPRGVHVLVIRLPTWLVGCQPACHDRASRVGGLVMACFPASAYLP